MFEAGEGLFRKCVKRVASRSLYALPLIRGRMKPEEVFQNSEIGGLQVLSKNLFPDDSFVRNGKSLLEGVLLHFFVVPTEVLRQHFTVLGDGASLQDIMIQPCILIHLNLVHMLILVSVCTSLVAIRFSASAQLVSSDLLSCYGGGRAEEAMDERERTLREKKRERGHDRQVQPPDPNTPFISQEAVGTVNFK
jgi:hypothetical protein